jgi:hypothetical protein
MRLVVNDPKTGWAHAKDIEVKSESDALNKIKSLRKKNPKLKFALYLDFNIDGMQRTFDYSRGKFTDINGLALSLYLTQKT